MRLLLLFPLLVCVDAGLFDFFKSKTTTPAPAVKKKIDDTAARTYLQKFGYTAVGRKGMPQLPAGMHGDLADARAALKAAIISFQSFAGIPKTGELDAATSEKMLAPRCGMEDVHAIGGAVYKWKKNNLVYSIDSFSRDLLEADQRKAIQEAYDLWATVTPLTFRPAKSGEKPDIIVRFAIDNHNDPWPFDGKGGVLAHATMPSSGILHFDDSENWAFEDAAKISKDYTDLLSVAIHEAGHTLGLEHSTDKNSIMAPFYAAPLDKNGKYDPVALESSDIAAIQSIYGGKPKDSGELTPVTLSPGKEIEVPWVGSSNGGEVFIPGGSVTSTTPSSRFTSTASSPTSTRATTITRATTTTAKWPSSATAAPAPAPSGGSARCPVSVDAYTPGPNGEAYIFSGPTVFELRNNKIVKAHSLSTLFPSAPSSIQAAVLNPIPNLLMLFKNGRVYGYYYSKIRGIFQMDSDFPKKLPDTITFTPRAGVRWANGHQMLFSDDDDFALYDEYWNKSQMNNKISKYFGTLPFGVRGISDWSGNVATVFTTTRVFDYNQATKTMVGESHSLQDFLKC